MKLNNDKGIVIFSGYNQRAVIAFLRSLIDIHFDNYVIVAKDGDDDIFLTQYSNNIIYIRGNPSLSYEDFKIIARKIKKDREWQTFVIAPTTEYLNRLIIKIRKQLEELGYVIPLVDEKLYKGISDKKSFEELCKFEGILVPETITFPEVYTEAFVCKPKAYQTKNGRIHTPVLIFSEKDYHNFTLDAPIEEFYFQKFVRGRSWYLLFYFSKDGTVYHFSQENLVEQSRGKSIIAAVADKYRQTAVTDQYKKMFQRIGYHGLVMVEVRENETGVYMIEANPRFWGPSQLFVDAGYNMFYPMLRDWGIVDISISKRIINYGAKYLWSGGIVEDMKLGRESYIFNNFDFEQLKKNDWTEWDVYNREDTELIWKKERYKN